MHRSLAKALEELGEMTEVRGVSANPSVVEDELLIGNVPLTERLELHAARRGQGKFRKAVEQYWKGCAVTGCTALDMLNASHIQPWSQCSDNRARLDRFNGLLLTPNLDRLFDRGLISFDEEGVGIRSKYLSDEAADALGISQSFRLRRVVDQHRAYLLFHQRRIFRS
jgi:predicted restriction endonuclease